MKLSYIFLPKKSNFKYALILNYQGNIIIFDEAHNVEKMCEESASIELRSLDIALCVDEVTQVIYFMLPKDVV